MSEDNNPLLPVLQAAIRQLVAADREPVEDAADETRGPRYVDSQFHPLDTEATLQKAYMRLSLQVHELEHKAVKLSRKVQKLTHANDAWRMKCERLSAELNRTLED